MHDQTPTHARDVDGMPLCEWDGPVMRGDVRVSGDASRVDCRDCRDHLAAGFAPVYESDDDAL